MVAYIVGYGLHHCGQCEHNRGFDLEHVPLDGSVRSAEFDKVLSSSLADPIPDRQGYD